MKLPLPTRVITAVVLIYGLCHCGLQAQEPDHLSMELQFRDSMLQVKARYQSVKPVNRDSVYFLLNPEYQLDTIRAEGLISYAPGEKKGEPLPYTRLQFDNSRKASGPLVADFEYTINLASQNHLRSGWIELSVDKLWFPNLDALDNTFTYEITLDGLPEDYRLFSHTDAAVSREGKTWVIRKDKPWFEVLILAGKNLRSFPYDRNLVLVGREEIPDSSLQSMGKRVRNSIDLLNAAFGQADPIQRFTVLLRNTGKDELSYQFNRRNMIITGTDFNDYANLSHEIAHYWWNRADFIREPWMNESFANYSMYLVLREFDPATYQQLLNKNLARSEGVIPVADAGLFTPDAYLSYYHKGAIALIRLEERIGTEAMMNLLSACVEQDIRSTAEFLQALESQRGREDRDFFSQLLRM